MVSKEMTVTQCMAVLHEEIEKIGSVAKVFPWDDKDHYAFWLAQTYYYVAHTTRLIALAAARMPIEEEGFYGRFVREILEERGHELLLINDLKAIGYSIKDFEELPETAFFYQTLSYLIDRENPVSILGYSLTLEGLSALKTHEYYHRAVHVFGEKACSFLKVHSVVDEKHFAAGLEFLKECPATSVAPIMKGARQCSAIYRNILSGCLEKVESRKLQSDHQNLQEERSWQANPTC
jgi:hypothetical protein